MRLENPRKNWKEGAKKNIWTTYYECRTISSEISETCHGVIFEQRPKFNTIFFKTSYGPKRIEFHKGGNTKPKVMKKL